MMEPCPSGVALVNAHLLHVVAVGRDQRAATGEPVGTVVRAVDLTTQLFEVRPTSGGETFYIPIIEDVIERIDRTEGVVTIHLLDGLLP